MTIKLLPGMKSGAELLAEIGKHDGGDRVWAKILDNHNAVWAAEVVQLRKELTLAGSALVDASEALYREANGHDAARAKSAALMVSAALEGKLPLLRAEGIHPRLAERVRSRDEERAARDAEAADLVPPEKSLACSQCKKAPLDENVGHGEPHFTADGYCGTFLETERHGVA